MNLLSFGLNPEWLTFFDGYPILTEKLIRLGFQIYIIDHQKGIIPPYLNRSGFEKQLALVADSWRIINSPGLIDQELIEKSFNLIHEIGEPSQFISFPGTRFIKHFRNDPGGFNYFILTSSADTVPVYDINCMLNCCQIQKSAYPIHASGVIKETQLYLFGGRSGTGKSTVSSISLNQGDKILDEDQLILREDKNGIFIADAWGYSLSESNARLTAVFKLVHHTRDKLIPLTKPQTSRFLFTQIIELTGEAIQEDLVCDTLAFSSRMARTIPGYEMHFRKSPDFWKLIDAELALG